jgi:GNAT superfamily N-acetyltransferase
MSEPEVRTLRRDEIDQVADLTARVFGRPEEVGPMRKLMRAAYESCPYMPPDLCWIAVDDGRLVAKWQVLDFQMWIAGTPIRMAGIQGVVAEPDANHKGYARLIAERALGTVRDQGFDLAFGFAQRGGFYTRLGAVPVCADYMLELDARQVGPLHDDPFRLATDADLPEVIRRYNESNAHTSGPLIRTEALWPWLVRRPQEIHLCADGYLGVTTFEDRIEIREVAGSGPAFGDAAVRKLGVLAREAGVRAIRGAVPPDHDFVNAAVPHGATLTTTWSKRSGCIALAFAPVRLLGRLRDALEARLRSARDADVGLDLGVRCAGEEARIVLCADAATTRKLDLVLSPGAVLQLAMGYRSASDVLVSEGRLQARAPGAEDVALLDVVFPRSHPFMWHTDRY